MKKIRHVCPAAGCGVFVAYELFMCKRHWFQLTPKMRDDVTKTYRRNMPASKEWMTAADIAIKFVNELEIWKDVQ